MCEVEAQNVKIGRKEDRYFRCDCEVVLSFGGPELTAQICWEDKVNPHQMLLLHVCIETDFCWWTHFEIGDGEIVRR